MLMNPRSLYKKGIELDFGTNPALLSCNNNKKMLAWRYSARQGNRRKKTAAAFFQFHVSTFFVLWCLEADGQLGIIYLDDGSLNIFGITGGNVEGKAEGNAGG